MDDAKKAYLNAIGKLTEKLEPKYYPKLSEIYSQLAEIASNSNKSKFLIKSKEYNILALKTGHTCTDLNALTPTPVKEKKVETTNTTTPLIPYNDLAWDNNLQILGNNLDGSGCLEPYKS
ncbi:MAG: hypothetical protein ACIPMY_06465 [Rickettsia endosymbiont of Pentastiridius leporinus]